MEIESVAPVLAVAVSLVGSALIVLTRAWPNIREGCSVVAGLLKFVIVLTMVPAILDGKTIRYTLLSLAPGIPILDFRVDALGLLFAATASFLWILTTFYSIGYMRSLREHAQTRYYFCFALTMSATLGVAFSSNLVTLYIFYELISFSTYPLVAHKETDEAFDKGNKYVFYLLMTSKGLLLASFMTYALTGSLDFKPNGMFSPGTNPTLVTITYFLFLIGIGKAAIMPFHAWLPAAMVAPTPVSALLHAVAVVNTGIFCILRIMFHVFGVDLMKELDLGVITAVIACITIIMGSLYALTRDNLKALLAYSTISQLSYMVLGGALLTPAGMASGIIHIANHALGKITLFLCVGSIYVAAHKTKVSELNGVARQMPFTMVAFTLGALSLIAIPPLGGFITKWYLTLGSIEAGEYPIVAVLIVSTILNACYFIPIVYAAFFRELPPGEKAERKEAPTAMVVPLALTAIGVLIAFFMPSMFLDLAKLIVGEVK
ncbi:MAG TPA: monovalent cation/H+ antiporter subunit D family protein [Nitrospiraceae bacterium]|nr:monovalent cation/H+ antiporter subunit D family protein [Nitrospiraceae bacterium]